MKVALIITTYNRPELLKKCLDSISELKEWPEYIIFIDDFSRGYEVGLVISDFSIQHDRDSFITSRFNGGNKGIKDSLIMGFEAAFYYDYDLAINLDPDAIVKPNFITELKRLKSLYPNHIVSGFNCDNPKNPVLIDNVDHVMRRHCNGINMCINKDQYETIVRPALLKEGNWDFNATNKLPFVIAKPSLVQHLAPNDSTMGHHGGDVACDF